MSTTAIQSSGLSVTRLARHGHEGPLRLRHTALRAVDTAPGHPLELDAGLHHPAALAERLAYLGLDGAHLLPPRCIKMTLPSTTARQMRTNQTQPASLKRRSPSLCLTTVLRP